MAVALIAAVVLAGLAPAPVPAASAADARATPDGCFIGVAHALFLDRPATDAELADWQDRFDTGTPRYRLPQELAASDEWLTVVVIGLYQQALDRNPDASGLAFWIDQLRAGALVNRVAALIYGSQEFYDNAGGTDSGFVTDLYQRILHRAPDGPGQAHWEGQVATLGRGRVASLFFASIESRTDRVEALYQQLLGRAADAAGLEHWTERLKTENDVRLAVLLASSTEFHTRAPSICTHTTRLTDGDNVSGEPSISDDARWIAFQSTASNLVPGDTNGEQDIFLHDRTTGTTVRVTDGDDFSDNPAISADGRHITFHSVASDLVPGDTNGHRDVFTWDRTTGTTLRITDGDDFSFNPAISADGRHITFNSRASDLVPGDTNGSDDIFTWDRTTDTTTAVTHGDNQSFSPAISADGRHITFNSPATDLVPDDTNGVNDIFVWTLLA